MMEEKEKIDGFSTSQTNNLPPRAPGKRPPAPFSASTNPPPPPPPRRPGAASPPPRAQVATPPKPVETPQTAEPLAAEAKPAEKPAAAPQKPAQPATPPKPAAKPNIPPKPVTSKDETAKQGVIENPTPEKKLKPAEKVADVPRRKTSDNIVETINDSRRENVDRDKLCEMYSGKHAINYKSKDKPSLSRRKAVWNKKYKNVLFISTKLDKKMFKPVFVFVHKKQKDEAAAGLIKSAMSKRKLLLLLLLLLLLIGVGIIIACVLLFSVKRSETSYYQYKDNVNFGFVDEAGNGLVGDNVLKFTQEDHIMPGHLLEFENTLTIYVPENTTGEGGEIKPSDIFAYAMDVSAYFGEGDNKVDAMPYIYFELIPDVDENGNKMDIMNEVYREFGHESIEEVDVPSQDGTFYQIRDSIYFRHLLHVGETKKLVKNLYISNELTNEYANKSITIEISVYAIFPTEEHFKDPEVAQIFKTGIVPEYWKEGIIAEAEVQEEIGTDN